MHIAHLTRRVAAATAATALIFASTTAVSTAEETGPADLGKAATTGATTVLGIDAGDLLQLRLLGEDGSAMLDEVAGTGEALTRLVPLTLASGLVPQLAAASIPPIEQRSTGAEERTETGATSLGDGLPGPLAGLLGGELDLATLLAVVDADGALGMLGSTISDLDVLGGLTSLAGADVLLGSRAAGDNATAGRSVTVDDLTVLDLTGLLGLLGLDLTDLSLDQLLGLVDSLGLLGQLGIDGIDDLGDLTGLVDDLLGGVDLLDEAILEAAGINIAELLAECTSLLGGLTGGLLGGVVGEVDCAEILSIQDLVDELTEILEGLLAELLGVVDDVLAVLDGAALLSVAGIDADVVASAAGTVEDSVAEVVAEIGAITVGGLDLGGLDVTGTVAELMALVDEVQGALDGVLAPLGLDGVVDIGLLETTTSITEADGLVSAVADLTALRATITPPDLCALLGGIVGEDTLGGLLGELDLPVPEVGTAVGGLLGELGSVLDCGAAAAAGDAAAAGLVDGVATALLEPLTVRAASVSGTSFFAAEAVPAQPAPPAAPAAPGAPAAPAQPTLPQTGGAGGWLLLAAALAGAASLGARRLLRAEGT